MLTVSTIVAGDVDAANLDRDERPFDDIAPQAGAVVIAGYGRVGQIVSRLLALKQIPFTVLEASPSHVDYVRRFGARIYYGDASRLELLEAAGVAQARMFVLAIDDVEASIKTAELVRKLNADLPRDLGDGPVRRNEKLPACSFFCEMAEQEYTA